MNMELFNIYGLIFVAIIMIPNVIFAIIIIVDTRAIRLYA